MAIASGSTVREAFIAESTFGTTPSTPTFQIFRHTGGGLSLDKGTGQSSEITAHRNVTAEFQLSHRVQGSYPFEFSDATLEEFLQAVLMGSWSSADILKVGTTFRSFTFEKTIDVGGGTYNYHRHLGCALDRMSINIAAEEAVTGSIDVVGKEQSDPATSIISGATYTAANTEAIMTGDTVASISVVGLSPDPIVKSISLSLANNLRSRPFLGSLFTDSFGMGQFEITGQIEAYYNSGALLQAIKDHTSGELSFNVGVTTGKILTITIPAAQLGNGRVVAGGNNGDEMITADFRGVYSSSDATSLIIERNVA